MSDVYDTVTHGPSIRYGNLPTLFKSIAADLENFEVATIHRF